MISNNKQDPIILDGNTLGTTVHRHAGGPNGVNAVCIPILSIQ